MKSDKRVVEIKNKKVYYEYFIIEEFEAGVMLVGTEVKSIRAGRANLSDAYCLFFQGELLLRSAYIAEYKFGNINNHEERRDRKLLLHKQELKKIRRRAEEKGFSIVPIALFVNERGLVKVQIGLAKGKKSYDKRNTIKEKDQKRDLDRAKSERF